MLFTTRRRLRPVAISAHLALSHASYRGLELVWATGCLILIDRGFGTSCLLHCSHLTVSANSEDRCYADSPHQLSFLLSQIIIHYHDKHCRCRIMTMYLTRLMELKMTKPVVSTAEDVCRESRAMVHGHVPDNRQRYRDRERYIDQQKGTSLTTDKN